MIQYDITVKANVEWGESVAVRILSRTKLSDSTLNMLKGYRLDDARKYCQNVLHATLIIL